MTENLHELLNKVSTGAIPPVIPFDTPRFALLTYPMTRA